MKPRGVDWDKQPLGEVPDRELSERLGVSVQSVHLARKVRGVDPCVRTIDWDKQPLGDGPDAILAEKLGVSVSAVCKARLRRGIPDGGIRSVDWASLPLGKVRDSEIAEMVDRPVCTVQQARASLGIPAYSEVRVCACGEEFETVYDHGRFCSEECQKAAARSRSKYRHGGDMDDVFVALSKLRREIVSKNGRTKW